MHATKRHMRIIIWWIKYWQFFLQIANRQSSLLANILSYTVVKHKHFYFIDPYASIE